jgi:hypothetical protein
MPSLCGFPISAFQNIDAAGSPAHTRRMAINRVMRSGLNCLGKMAIKTF